MKITAQSVFAIALMLLSSLAAAGVMYAFTDDMSPLAFLAWAIFFAAAQIALLPSYKQGTCRIMDRFYGQKVK